MTKAIQKIKLFAISLLAATGASFLFVSNTFAENKYPEPSTEFYVNDLANVISDETEAYIIDCNKKLSPSTGAQIVVMTVESLNGEAIEDYANGVFNQYGIGAADKDNGLLILLSVGDRQSRVEVGSGAEGFITDAGSGRIQDNYMVPEFKNNNWDAGLKKGFDVFLALYEKEYEVEISEGANIYDYENMSESYEEEFGNFSSAFVSGYVSYIIATIFGSKKNRPKRAIIGFLVILIGIIAGFSAGFSLISLSIIGIGIGVVLSSIFDTYLGVSGSGGRYGRSGGSSGGFSGGSHGGGGHSSGGGSSRSF